MKINLHCLVLFSFIQKFTKFQPIIEVKQLESGGENLIVNKCFHYFMLATIIGTQLLQCPFPRVTALSFSPIMPEEFWRTPDKRSETFFFIQNLSRSFRFTLLLFSSPHSFSVGFRSEDRDSHGKIFIFMLSDPFVCYFDVCFGLLSWWKIQHGPL